MKFWVKQKVSDNKITPKLDLGTYPTISPIPVEFFLNNTNLTFLYKIDIEGFQNQQK